MLYAQNGCSGCTGSTLACNLQFAIETIVPRYRDIFSVNRVRQKTNCAPAICLLITSTPRQPVINLFSLLSFIAVLAPIKSPPPPRHFFAPYNKKRIERERSLSIGITFSQSERATDRERMQKTGLSTFVISDHYVQGLIVIEYISLGRLCCNGPTPCLGTKDSVVSTNHPAEHLKKNSPNLEPVRIH